MAILNNSNAISSGGYDINNSLRLRQSASAYLNRTFGSTYTDKTKSTVSFWVKRGVINYTNGQTVMWYNASGASGNFTFAGGGAGGSLVNDCFVISNRNATTGASDYTLQTTQLFRDPSAWYHIIVVYDTGQATSSNRIKIYVNGNQVTAFTTATYPSQNYQTTAFLGGNSAAHIIGYGAIAGPTEYFDGYLADFNFIDGSAKTPSDFGETDTTTGVWKPKAYTGTYGTNGFYLKFSDIATTSGSNAGLGKDFSGNTNYWTTNNISVTAGTTYDAMIDSPTLTSATVGNYCVWNPLLSGTKLSTSNGNLNYASATTGASEHMIGTFMMPAAGKWYFEVTPTSFNTADGSCRIGISRNGSTDDSNLIVYNATGNFETYGVTDSAPNTYTQNDIIGVAVNFDADTVTFYKNNTSEGSKSFGSSDEFVPYVRFFRNSGTMTGVANFGQRPFAYTPPTGFVALNTYNLPDSTIKKGNTVMDATLYTGTGASLSVTNAGAFKPDFVWVKGRSGATDHAWYDSVRGTTKQIESNTTTAETTEAQGLTAFGTSGFTVGTLAQMNTSAATYVGWQWQAGQGSTSSNTSGSITSTVSVNTTAGFSVVTYTGTGANATVGHGLGVAPRFIIVKQRGTSGGGDGNWLVGSTAGIGWTGRLILNGTFANEVNSTHWNNTAPTSTVFSLGTSGNVNGNTGSYVAYCFAAISGYSAFDSYTGNGSADGPFVYTGFRPKYLLIKVTSAVEDWMIFDSARGPYNANAIFLRADTADTGGSDVPVDFLSNGFKLRSTALATNSSGNAYIYMAFAENPFKNALAR
jgi:hypothetical protein